MPFRQAILLVLRQCYDDCKLRDGVTTSRLHNRLMECLAASVKHLCSAVLFSGSEAFTKLSESRPAKFSSLDDLLKRGYKLKSKLGDPFSLQEACAVKESLIQYVCNIDTTWSDC